MRQVIYEGVKPLNFADKDSQQRTIHISSSKIWNDGTAVDSPKKASKKQERMLDVPSVLGGKDIKVVSSTMDPASMKEFKQMVTESPRRRRPGTRG